MTYLYYSILGLVLLIIQTTIIPEIAGTQGPYDLIALIIFYLGLYHPFRRGLPKRNSNRKCIGRCQAQCRNISGSDGNTQRGFRKT